MPYWLVVKTVEGEYQYEQQQQWLQLRIHIHISSPFVIIISSVGTEPAGIQRQSRERESAAAITWRVMNFPTVEPDGHRAG